MRTRTSLPAVKTRLVQLGAGMGLLLAVGCGGSSPASPSSTPAGGGGATNAVIAGTVSSSQSGPSLSGLRAEVAGTNISTAVEDSGAFQLSGVPAGSVRLQFRNSTINAGANIADVKPDQMIQVQVQLNGTSAVIVQEQRSAKVSLCHKEGNGSYHLIDVSVDAESAHRAHGDGKIGDPVPGQTGMTFDAECRPAGASVDIEKFTNGEDADSAPGPQLLVGSAVTWRYVVVNTGTLNLTSVAVVDDKGVSVSCGQVTLAPAATMTCTGTGVATLGQYRNVGTVTANWVNGSTSGTVTDSDPSHYLGIAVQPPDNGEGPKVVLCHKTGNGSFHSIEVSVNAEPAHRAHGDGKIGVPVPGQPGKIFNASCGVQ